MNRRVDYRRAIYRGPGHVFSNCGQEIGGCFVARFVEQCSSSGLCPGMLAVS